MKKVLFLLAMLPLMLFTACSSDDEPKQTTYTLKWNADISSTSIVSVDVWLFEYNENGEIIGNSTINEIQSGYVESFVAKEKSVKVKVQVRMSGGTSNSNEWVQQVFYLQKEGNTDIPINNETIIGTKEP